MSDQDCVWIHSNDGKYRERDKLALENGVRIRVKISETRIMAYCGPCYKKILGEFKVRDDRAEAFPVVTPWWSRWRDTTEPASAPFVFDPCPTCDIVPKTIPFDLVERLTRL